MESGVGRCTRELLVLSAELRDKSLVLREQLRDAEWEAQNLRSYAMRWLSEQRKILPCYDAKARAVVLSRPTSAGK